MAAKTKSVSNRSASKRISNRNGVNPKPVIIDDSTLRYQIAGQTEVIELNPLRVKLLSQPLEVKHKLQTVENAIIGTWDFAEDLGRELGVPTVVANQAWIDACQWWADQQKKTN